MSTSCGRSMYLIVAVIALDSCCCNAFYCHICGSIAATHAAPATGDPCTLDNVCESDACFLVTHRGGTWNASCTDPWAAEGRTYKRRGDVRLMFTDGSASDEDTEFGTCSEDLCNDPKRESKLDVDFYILPKKAEKEVVCNVCGYPKTAAAGIGNRSIACTGHSEGVATCTGDFCVTVKGDHPRYSCGDAWLLAQIGRNLSDILGCQTLPNGEERCVCDTNDCNKPAASLGPGSSSSRRLNEAIAGYVEDFYASASTEEKKVIEMALERIQDRRSEDNHS